jgi:hypothetical protein
MNNNDIVQLVKSMDVKPLTIDTFNEFETYALELFAKTGDRFQEYFSPGYNNRSKERYDFSKGKPEYLANDIAVFKRIEHREVPAEGKKWLYVYFDKGCGVWGNRPGSLPLKFGFDPGKALYIAEQDINGTQDYPRESLFLKL